MVPNETSPAPSPPAQRPPSKGSSARVRVVDALLLSAAAALLLVALEWLFFVTKPSMFSVMGWPERAAVLLSSALPVMAAAVLVAAPLALLGRFWPVLAVLVPALLTAATGFLMVENFTKTVLGFNVGSFGSPVRTLYAVGFAAVVVLALWRLRRLVTGTGLARRRAALAGLGVGTVLMVGVAAFRYAPAAVADGSAGAAGGRRPNILILSSDGIEARRMSVYGYERPTTPFLDSRRDEFLLSENHFTNARLTAASMGALLTGKLPITTGVTHSPRVFLGRDTYEHLPALLRQRGYYSLEVGARHFADSFAVNLRQGFDASSSRALTTGSLTLLRWYGSRFPSEAHFLESIADRLGERAAHVLGLAEMVATDVDPMDAQPRWQVDDDQRIRTLKEILDKAPRPFFANVHLLNTHGPDFKFDRTRFSADVEPGSKWNPDRLDDAILAFDGYVEEMVGYLEARGELESTVVVVNTDHGLFWASAERLPLLIRFPGGEHAGRIVANTQRIDIAPTLLTYLGLSPPQWMEGRSLLTGELDPLQPIYSTGKAASASFVDVALIQCHLWTELDPDGGQLRQRRIVGHTAPCPEEELVPLPERGRRIVEHLDASPHFTPPLLLGARLYELRDRPDPEQRERLARAIREGVTRVRELDDELLLARVGQDLWTYGASPAALLVVNEGDRPLTRQLEVRSGGDREFPFTFHVEDGVETHEHRFETPGTLAVELPPVPPRSHRLYILWSDRPATRAHGRLVGVGLASTFGDSLRKLVRRPDREARQKLAAEILSEEIPSRHLDEGARVAGTHWDLWTFGIQPAAVAVRNDGEVPRVVTLRVGGGAGRELPVRFHVEDGKATREHILAGPGPVTVELAPVPPGGQRLYVVWSESWWRPGERVLGVKLLRPGA